MRFVCWALALAFPSLSTTFVLRMNSHQQRRSVVSYIPESSIAPGAGLDNGGRDVYAFVKVERGINRRPLAPILSADGDGDGDDVAVNTYADDNGAEAIYSEYEDGHRQQSSEYDERLFFQQQPATPNDEHVDYDVENDLAEASASMIGNDDQEETHHYYLHYHRTDTSGKEMEEIIPVPYYYSTGFGDDATSATAEASLSPGNMPARPQHELEDPIYPDRPVYPETDLSSPSQAIRRPQEEQNDESTPADADDASSVLSYDAGSQTPRYHYSYAVKDNYSLANFGHREASDGRSTTGAYFVLLPDHRLQVVDYVADENGYFARVSYRGNRPEQGRN